MSDTIKETDWKGYGPFPPHDQNRESPTDADAADTPQEGRA